MGGVARGFGGARRGGGEVALLPEEEDLFEAGEEAGEDGEDEGVDGIGRNPPVRRWACDGALASKLVGQRGIIGQGPLYGIVLIVFQGKKKLYGNFL